MHPSIPQPWSGAMQRRGLTSYRRLADAAGLSVETVRAAVLGLRTRVAAETLEGLSRALDRDIETIGRWLGSVTPDGAGAYLPPSEAQFLNARERRAIDEVIRAMVAGRRTQTQDRPPDADWFDLAARRGYSQRARLDREADMAGEENQDGGGAL